MTARKTSKSKRSVLLPLFVLFILIALITVMVLEYIDFRNGKASFIFEKIIKLKMTGEDKSESNQFKQQLIKLFNRNHIKFNYFLDQLGKYHFKLDVNQEEIKNIVRDIKKISSGLNYLLELSEMRQQTHKTIHLYHIKKNQDVTHIILITCQVSDDKIPEKKAEDLQPKVAFIIDDIGNRSGISLDLKKLNIPITASILPESSFAFDEARQIKQYELQAMIHIPMQPKNSKNSSYQGFTIIQTHSDIDEMRQIVLKARQIIPHARGVNNHEGSLITSKKGIITKFLRIIKQEGLFFVDSRTTSETVAYDMARELKIQTAFRDIFLDSEKTYPHSMKQIQKLITVALKKGKAIAIGHPFQTTFQAIRDSIKSIRDRGIKIVFVSQILE
ncbi:MAG: divergent polysaccharide deacetylase family protein [Candidatus Aminicenantes bacterium]|nr:divergent polysaccharide deacetylase family protein [Candidatus Aminicenantes bacterium]